MKRLELTIGIMVLGLLLAACGAKPTPTAFAVVPTEAAATPSRAPLLTSEPRPTATPTASQDDMLAAITGALGSVSQLSHRSVSDSVFADGRIVTATVEFAPPDRKHFFSHDGEMLVVDNRVYSKRSGEDEWTELELHAGQMSYPSFGQDFGGVQFLGQEDLNGMPMLVYRVSPVDKEVGVLTLWISPEDDLLYKLVNDGELSSVDSSTGEMKTSKAITTAVFLYDPGIVVAAPTR